MNSLRMSRAFRIAAIAALVSFAQACGGGDGITVTTPACTPVDLTFPGTVTGTTADCTSGGFRAKVYRFTANANFANAFAATSDFQNLGVEVMSDPQGTNNVVWVSTNAAVVAEWLLPPGNYLVRVTSRTGSGDFELEGYTTSLNTTDCTVRTLVVGVTLADHAIETTDCVYSDPVDGTYFDAYGILSSKPCTIAMSSATMDTFLQIRNATQSSVITGDDDGGGGTNSLVSLPACNNNNGPIVIMANTATATPATGNYTLVVTIVGGGSIVAGDNVTTPMTFDPDSPIATSIPVNVSKTNLVKKVR